MPSFTIFGSSTTAQTLTDGQTGYVGPNGALVTTGTAIDATNGVGLTILGAVTSQSDPAIWLDRTGAPPDLADMIVSIGATGQVTTLSGAAVYGDITNAELALTNNGVLSGQSGGIRLYDYLSTSQGELRIFNAGTISGGGGYGGIYYAGSGGTAHIVNSGTIASLSQAKAVNMSGSGFELHNTGDILGDVSFSGSGLVENGGRIQGDIALGGITGSELHNAGDILGKVSFGGDALVVNTRLIDGDIEFGGVTLSELQNAGDILGNVVFTGRALVVNTGLIQGDIAFGAANDDFTSSGGRVTGTVDGGEGNDTYRIDDATIVITDSGGIEDTVYSSVTFALGLGLERLSLTGSGDIRGIGNGSANSMVGNAGDNRISGQGGNDTMTGGVGDDTLRGGSGNDQFLFDPGNDVLNGGNGIDTFNLAASLAAFLVDLSAGIATSDTADDDSLTGIENVQGGLGADTVTGSTDANNLRGGSGDDVLRGGGGNDTLTGQSGADTLTGSNGADLFVYEAFADSPANDSDTIADFRTAQGDLIDLSLIDANALGAGNGTFLFSTAGFLPEGVPSVRVTQDVANNITIVEARDSVGASVDLRIILTGLLTLTAADFVL